MKTQIILAGLFTCLAVQPALYAQGTQMTGIACPATPIGQVVTYGAPFVSGGRVYSAGVPAFSSGSAVTYGAPVVAVQAGYQVPGSTAFLPMTYGSPIVQVQPAYPYGALNIQNQVITSYGFNPVYSYGAPTVQTQVAYPYGAPVVTYTGAAMATPGYTVSY
jgi:hypothetical protein